MTGSIGCHDNVGAEPTAAVDRRRLSGSVRNRDYNGVITIVGDDVEADLRSRSRSSRFLLLAVDSYRIGQSVGSKRAPSAVSDGMVKPTVSAVPAPERATSFAGAGAPSSAT